MQTGEVPRDWVDAHITPLHKKGPRSNCNNYRPVSLTSQVVKLLERIVLDNIKSLLQVNNTIIEDQHGFQSKSSCTTQLLECLNDWTKDYDDAHQTDIIYLDFQKAFDSVPHQRLLRKLEQHGIKGRVLSWISSFLTDRRQRVVLRNGVSTWQQVTSGVPQGTILGPILFLLYINDISENVSSHTKMFADDTKLYNTIHSIADCEILQADLDKLSNWAKKWLLKFNVDKCVVLKTKTKHDYTYTLNGVSLQEAAEQKDLGVTIANTLTPRNHIQNIVKKSNQRIGLIKRCFSYLSEKRVSILYRTIVRPVLEYGCPVWSPWHLKDIYTLEKVQSRCLKLTKTDIKLQSLEQRRRNYDLCEAYKYLHNLYKTPSNTYFTPVTRSLRGHSLKIQKQFARTDIRRNFFSNRVVSSWNELPDEIVTSRTLARFKRQLTSLA